MMQQRPVFQPFSKKKIQQIFLGIDFGTSYTKVSYSYAPSSTPQIHTLKWDDDFFKKSILYFQNGRLFFDKPIGNFDEIKYFKYSILEPKLQNNHQDTKCNFEELCCVYFLAQLIKHSLTKIFKLLQISNYSDIEISVNMGVPLENFYNEKNRQNKDLYSEILENAVTLAGGSKIKARLPENQVLLSNLDDVYSEILCKKAELNWKVHVFPELAAELLLYHESKFVHDGLYAVIDVGGGTVDIALFQKQTDSITKEPVMDCVGQKVLPYGIEVKETLQNLQETRKLLQNEFCCILMKAKQSSKINFHFFNNINLFFLGGGANDVWYTDGIKKCISEHRLDRANLAFNFNQNINIYIQNEEMLIEKNQRLVISQMLARHADEITKPKGFPDFFNSPNDSNMPPSNDNDDKAKNSGWDDNEH